MANHCFNFVQITGDEEILEEILKRLDNYEKFNYISNFFDYVLSKRTDIPLKPEDKTRLDYNHYGTKWWDIDIQESRGELIISGDTAWGPPLLFVEELCRQYDLHAIHEYEEPGMNFAGIAKFGPEGEIDHQEMTYSEYKYANNYDAWFEDALYCLSEIHEDDDTEGAENYKKELLEYCSQSDIDDLLIQLKKE